jgi:hypothetical protein
MVVTEFQLPLATKLLTSVDRNRCRSFEPLMVILTYQESILNGVDVATVGAHGSLRPELT